MIQLCWLRLIDTALCGERLIDTAVCGERLIDTAVCGVMLIDTAVCGERLIETAVYGVRLIGPGLVADTRENYHILSHAHFKISILSMLASPLLYKVAMHN